MHSGQGQGWAIFARLGRRLAPSSGVRKRPARTRACAPTPGAAARTEDDFLPDGDEAPSGTQASAEPEGSPGFDTAPPMALAAPLEEPFGGAPSLVNPKP